MGNVSIASTIVFIAANFVSEQTSFVIIPVHPMSRIRTLNDVVIVTNNSSIIILSHERTSMFEEDTISLQKMQNIVK